MDSGKILLADLVDMENPHEIFKEVKTIVNLIQPGFDVKTLKQVFSDVVRLFRGEYDGYARCTTEYHDLKHTTDAFLSFARLIHGAHVCGVQFKEREINLGLICSLMHDTGYIQKKTDIEGTGAKYTFVHVDRSIEFTINYLREHNHPEEDLNFCKNVIKCTCLNTKPSQIVCPTKESELMGKMLGTSDIIGQIADRTYLEKLLFLFREFNECHVMGYKNELDLLKKTINFYEVNKKRLELDLDNVKRYMQFHFKSRWNMDTDLYKSAIENNLKFLQHIMKHHEKDYRNKLKRGGIVKKLIYTRPFSMV